MNREQLVEYLKTASMVELQENITAGPGDGMAFRYSATVAELERRRAETKSTTNWPMVSALVALAVFCAYVMWKLVEVATQ
jgi:hypothetical protein